jgi:hypothetical protein
MIGAKCFFAPRGLARRLPQFTRHFVKCEAAGLSGRFERMPERAKLVKGRARLPIWRFRKVRLSDRRREWEKVSNTVTPPCGAEVLRNNAGDGPVRTCCAPRAGESLLRGSVLGAGRGLSRGAGSDSVPAEGCPGGAREVLMPRMRDDHPPARTFPCDSIESIGPRRRISYASSKLRPFVCPLNAPCGRKSWPSPARTMAHTPHPII